MSIRTPTPHRIRQPTSLASLVARLVAAGWRVETLSLDGDRRLSYAFVAHARNERQQDVAMVVHGAMPGFEVRIDDVWRLVARMNAAHGDFATLCVPASSRVSPLATATAEHLGLKIVRAAV